MPGRGGTELLASCDRRPDEQRPGAPVARVAARELGAFPRCVLDELDIDEVEAFLRLDLAAPRGGIDHHHPLRHAGADDGGSTPGEQLFLRVRFVAPVPAPALRPTAEITSLLQALQRLEQVRRPLECRSATFHSVMASQSSAFTMSPLATSRRKTGDEAGSEDHHLRVLLGRLVFEVHSTGAPPRTTHHAPAARRRRRPWPTA